MLVAFLGGCGHTASFRKTTDEPAKAARVPILLYHHVRDLPATASPLEKRWSLAPQKFAAQMDWLEARGFHPITMSQLIAHLKHGQLLPPRPIVLTFDDGWKDQYGEALPILQKHGFVATFFIITDSVGHSAYMNWEQVQEMAARGMDIQSHAHSHARLPILSRAKARDEIQESKRILEDRLRKPVAILSYPYGSYDDEVIALTKAAGFVAAVTIGGKNGGYLFRADQSYSLVRYGVEGNDNLDVIARLKGF